MRMSLAVALFIMGLSVGSLAKAQPAPHGPAITAEQAEAVMTAAEAVARRNGWVVAIAIVENSGDLVLFKKATGTQYGSVEVALNKATASAQYRRSTKMFADQLASGSLIPLSLPGAIAIEGGLPIIVGGLQIGAIGVSGVTAEQDGVIAAAGAAAVQ